MLDPLVIATEQSDTAFMFCDLSNFREPNKQANFYEHPTFILKILKAAHLFAFRYLISSIVKEVLFLYTKIYEWFMKPPPNFHLTTFKDILKRSHYENILECHGNDISRFFALSRKLCKDPMYYVERHRWYLCIQNPSASFFDHFK